ncbi:hypothetical protein [uncultured Desulfovibrio sp.]|uniref:hypothetical protein n=1 Tax=uncultured Desulfovibrio sp. TaxID=167968 RepID=UPI002618B665|nr:hypothetical protein [uncultured Desulfovibrio sp.]
MTKQLTPAEELRCYYKAATILAEMLANGFGGCPDPEQFNPAGKCAHPSSELCGKCFREWAVNKAINEMESSK